MNLRTAKESDVSRLIELMTQLGTAYLMTEEVMKERIKKCSSNGNHLIVAEDNGRVVGLVAFSCYELFRLAGSQCYIDALVVDDQCRGKGVGKQLISYVEKYANENGVISLSLISSNARIKDGTHEFYKKLGYQTQFETNHTYFSKALRVLKSLVPIQEEKKEGHELNHSDQVSKNKLSSSTQASNLNITLFSQGTFSASSEVLPENTDNTVKKSGHTASL